MKIVCNLCKKTGEAVAIHREGGIWETYPLGWYVRHEQGELPELACSPECARALDRQRADARDAASAGIAGGIAALGDMSLKDAASLLHDLWAERKKKK